MALGALTAPSSARLSSYSEAYQAKSCENMDVFQRCLLCPCCNQVCLLPPDACMWQAHSVCGHVTEQA